MLGSEDVVCSTAGVSTRYGVVTCAQNDSSSESDSDSDCEWGGSRRKLRPGHARVTWFHNDPRVCRGERDQEQVPEGSLRLLDRALMPGDVVKRQGTSSKQRGYVMDVILQADLCLITNPACRLHRVDTRRLERQEQDGLYCVYQSHLGEVTRVTKQVVFQLSNGYVYSCPEEILANHALDVFDKASFSCYYYRSFFYPGQTVKFKRRLISHNGVTCLLAPDKDTSFEVFGSDFVLLASVRSVETESVDVQWILRCFHPDSPSSASSTAAAAEAPLPPPRITGEDTRDIMYLDRFACLSFCLGDKALLRLTPKDIRAMSRSQSKQHQIADVKDQVVDASLKQMKRRFGASSKRKTNAFRVHFHTAIDKDHQKDLMHLYVQAGDMTTSVFKFALIDLAKANQVQNINENHLDEAATKLIGISKSCADLKFAEVISTLSLNLKTRGQLRELQLLEYILQAVPEKLQSKSDDNTDSLSLNLENLPKILTTFDLLCCVDTLVECWSETQRNTRKLSESSLAKLDELRESGCEMSSGKNYDELEPSTQPGGDHGDAQTPHTESQELMEDDGDSAWSDVTSPGPGDGSESGVQVLNGAVDRACPWVCPNPRRASVLAPGDLVPVKVVMTRTVVEILWQDGSTESNIPSTDLENVHHLDDNEFFPGDFVGDLRTDTPSLGEVYGVVQSTDYAQRTCQVRWFSDASNDRGAVIADEKVSVYDIKDLGHFSTNVLEIVARVSHEGPLPSDGCPPLGTAGILLGVELASGLVRVSWAEGHESLVHYQNLINIEEEDVAGTTTSDDGSWATASQGSQGNDNNTAKGDNKTGTDEEWETEEEETATNTPEFHTPDSGHVGSSRDQTPATPVSRTRAAAAQVHSTGKFQRQLSSVSMDSVQPGMDNQMPRPFVAHLFETFPKFETLENVASHKFASSVIDTLSKTFMTSLKKEYKLLRTSLPDGIFVRTFEDRQDLFSCLIIGTEGTPYEQGLFMFDIKLPGNYPAEPPKVSFISYTNGKLNPNLYESGHVCLSLLGTWIGSGVEMWSPTESNLLQLVVSLQGLILNKAPYYNEAGYEKQRGQEIGQENAKVYNEMVLIRLAQSSICQMLTPYETFSQLILQHFKFVGHMFVSRMEHWAMDDTVDDSLPEFPLYPLSEGFKQSLKREITRLKSALTDIAVLTPPHDKAHEDSAHERSRIMEGEDNMIATISENTTSSSIQGTDDAEPSNISPSAEPEDDSLQFAAISQEQSFQD